MGSDRTVVPQERPPGSDPQPPGVAEVVQARGNTLDAGSLHEMQSRFGHDFSQIRIHTDEVAAASARDAGALAYTVGSHVVFGQGQYEPHTMAGRRLLAHELSHTLQQQRGGISFQRRAESGAATSDAAERESETIADSVATPTASLIVEDDAEQVANGQMRKSEFLDAVTAAACAAADAQLAAAGRSSDGCPYVAQILDRARGYTASRVERGVRLYVPATVSATTANDYIAPFARRVAEGVTRWMTTGEITGVPAELMPAEATAVPFLALKREHDGGGSYVSAAHVSAQLGKGAPLDTVARGRMERAFGFDFGSVRVHTDTRAVSLAARLGARAFTTGKDIAFASGEYKPGDILGEALIAHELAHVVQQGGGTAAQGTPSTGSALEEDADRSAIGAVVSAWSRQRRGLAEISVEAFPRLRSGLRLQRCKNNTPAPAAPDTTFNAGLNLDAQAIRIIQGVVGAPQTGTWDQQTQQQIMVFQRANGLTPDGNVRPDTMRKITETLIAASQFDDTIHLIVNSSHFPTTNLDSIRYDPTVTGADAVTGGTIGTGQPQTVSVGPSAFTASYEHMIRIIGHELQHVQQRSGATPIVDQHVREFLSFAWEALSTDTAPLPAAERVQHAQIAIRHWDRAAAADRAPHQDVRDRLDRLIAANGVGNF
jgi:peptidoglycan hydrolase-like protein with peptidoglycan-binding domain